jgi:membrane-bound lytic murein transglycosylase MltF
MRHAAAALLAALLAACGNGRDTAAPVPEPAASAPIDIPRSDGRPVSAESDMRVLEPFTGDLDAMIDRGIVRVLVAPSVTHFGEEGHLQRGRTVDAAIAFERFVNQRISPRSIAVLLISTSETALVSDVIAGQGDIAANVLRTFERDEQVAFAKPMRSGVRELIVTAPGVSPLVSLEDAGGRAIHVRRNSDHHASLVRLNDQLKKIERPQAKIVFTPSSPTDEELLDLVNGGRIPATIVDDYIYDARRSQLQNTAVNRDVAVSQDGELAWVTRKDAPRLLALLNEFFATHRLAF